MASRFTMWRPPITFITLHYAWIIFMGLLSFVCLYPEGNLSAVDAYFFGASASTESGLNTIDVKELRTYQQLYMYFIPMFTNLGFINIAVVVVRLFWFRKHLQKNAPRLLNARRHARDDEEYDMEKGQIPNDDAEATSTSVDAAVASGRESRDTPSENLQMTAANQDTLHTSNSTPSNEVNDERASDSDVPRSRIAFDPSVEKEAHPKHDATLYIPGPRDREKGQPLTEVSSSDVKDDDDLAIEPIPGPSDQGLRRRFADEPRMSESKSIDRVATIASSMFVLGSQTRPKRRPSAVSAQQPPLNDMPYLSRQVTVGRNSQFYNLTSRLREEIGGIEYRSLKLLLKIVVSYFFGLHLFGAICLVGWIQYADPKYKNYLHEVGQDMNWWAFYSAQTMIDNLGFTLTPDSMVSFRDAGWPMFIMSFLAFAGNTLYPVFLRLVIWTMSKLAPRDASVQEPLAFLLSHPRRCYTLLFPSGTTWALFGIIFALNFVDTLLIVVLDLHNPAVAELPVGPRILAAIFQAASSRHTGTSTFNLADVNPAVQFSLLVMMYISIFPVAISIRLSNTYEEKALGIYERDGRLDETRGTAYLLKHMQNQLSFDLWYIFLGIFCICIAESDRIMDKSQAAFAVFPLFFEVVSAYGNVGLSLGYPTVATSLSGQFSTFSKLVICAMMIRGRHRGLPYQLDRAIMLPDDESSEGTGEEER